jgi:hypothetical protein
MEVQSEVFEGVLKCTYKGNRIYFEQFNYYNITSQLNSDELDCVFILNCKGDIVIEVGKVKKHKDNEYDVLFLDVYDYKYYEVGRKEYEYIVSFGVI